MQGKATIGGHPIHPMLIPFPIGFLVGALVCDVILAFTRNPFWPQVSVVLIGFGIVGALLAPVWPYRLRDGVDVGGCEGNGDPAHGSEPAGVAIFVAAFWLRLGNNVSSVGIVLTIIGVIVLALGGYLGGHLSYHFGVGVEEQSLGRGIVDSSNDQTS